MTEKELFVKLCENWVAMANHNVVNARQSLEAGHRKLQADYDLTVAGLEHTLKEAQIRKKNQALGTKVVDKQLADENIAHAKRALYLGKLKAKVDFDKGYNELKLELERCMLHKKTEESFLQFAQSENERGFSL